MSTADLRDGDDDPFVILGVSRNCTPSELKQVYRLLARRYHPDVNPGPEAAAQMKRINLAYDRALAQVERTARLRSPQTSTMTVATQQQPASPPGMARVFGNVRIARVVTRRRGHRRAIILWLSGIVSVAVIALIILVVFRALRLSSSAPGVSDAHPPLLRLNAATPLNWQDDGVGAVTERLIAQLPPGFHLNEAPEWSHDGAYVAVSVSPAGSNGSAASDASTILVMQGKNVLRTVAGTSARWSPVTNQLAVLTAQGAGNAPQLELYSSPTASAPTILDSGAATHLAWSDDGTQIAYSANGQQQLRLASVGQGAPRMLKKTHGQRLIPLGWLGDQVVEIVHNSGAISLVGVDARRDQSALAILATLDDLATETTVAISQGGVAYLTKTQAAPFVTFHWLAPNQQWRAELPGVPDVRFLAGWSDVGGWMALAPVASPADTNTGASEVCFGHEPHAASGALTHWPLHCLLIPGALEGMNWEPHSGTLSYVREAQPGGRLELRALHIQSGVALTTSGQVGAVQRHPADPPSATGRSQAMRDVRQGESA